MNFARLLLLSLAVVGSSAFTPATRTRHSRARSIVMDSGDSNPLLGAINAFGNMLTASPINEGKKALVKSLAGPYDEVAVRAKLDGLVSSEPVIMLSFTT
jgi:hypothetical protein